MVSKRHSFQKLWSCGRVFTKAAVVRRLSGDDYTILGAMILSAGQTGAILSASANGLGRQWSGLQNSQRLAFEKAYYASGLLFILTIVLTKLSIVLFLRDLPPIQNLQKAVYALGAVFLTWGVGSLLVAAFQCSVPDTWHSTSTHCVNIRLFWISFHLINILTDAVLVTWTVAIVSRLHTSGKRRATFIAGFASRIMVIGACIAQLIYTFPETRQSDLPYSLWPLTICTQIVQCTSITTACIPYLQPFLLSLESGLLKSDDFRNQSIKHSRKQRSLSKPALRSKPLSNFEDTEAALTQSPGMILLPLPVHTSGESSQGQTCISGDSRTASR